MDKNITPWRYQHYHYQRCPAPNFNVGHHRIQLFRLNGSRLDFLSTGPNHAAKAQRWNLGQGEKHCMLVCNGGAPHPCHIFGWKTNAYISCASRRGIIKPQFKGEKMLAPPCKMTSNVSSEIHWFLMVYFQKTFFSPRFHVSSFVLFYVVIFCRVFYPNASAYTIYHPKFQCWTVGHDRVQLLRLRAWFLCAVGPTMQPKHSTEIWGDGRQKLAC